MIHIVIDSDGGCTVYLPPIEALGLAALLRAGTGTNTIRELGLDELSMGLKVLRAGQHLADKVVFTSIALLRQEDEERETTW